MGDFFDLNFGSDPFGGGFEGLAQMVPSTGGLSIEDPNVSVPTSTFVPDMSQYAGGDQGRGFGDVAKAVGGDIKSGMKTAAGFAEPILPFAQLGTAGMGIAAGVQGAKTAASNAATGRRAQKLQEQVAGQQAAAAQPLTEFGKKQLDASSAGQVPPAEEARIQNWLQGAIQHAQDYAARSGQGNSLMLTQWVNWLNKQADEMRAAAIGEQQRLGITGLAAGANALGGAGQTAGNIQTGAQNQSAAIAQLMEQANKALASLTAGAA